VPAERTAAQAEGKEIVELWNTDTSSNVQNVHDQEAEEKNKAITLPSVPYDCTPPDSERHMDAVGHFCLILEQP
jgi:hypothetical protein